MTLEEFIHTTKNWDPDTVAANICDPYVDLQDDDEMDGLIGDYVAEHIPMVNLILTQSSG